MNRKSFLDLTHYGRDKMAYRHSAYYVFKYNFLYECDNST